MTTNLKFIVSGHVAYYPSGLQLGVSVIAAVISFVSRVMVLIVFRMHQEICMDLFLTSYFSIPPSRFKI